MLKKIVNIVVLLLLLLIFGLTFIWSVSIFIVKHKVVVPNVVNMNLKEAQRVIRKHHLKFIIEGNTLSNFKKNKIKFTNIEILNQYPNAGQKILRRFKISLFVRIIEETTKVPDIIGLDSVNARFKIENNNLKVGNISYVRSKVDLNDKVIYQEPIEGTSVKNGTKINYYINSGVSKKYILVPYLMNNDINYVRSSLKQLGLITYNNMQTGEVVSQSLIPGNIVTVNSNITFDIVKNISENTEIKPIRVNNNIGKRKFFILNYTFSSFLGTRNGKIYLSSNGKREKLLSKNIRAGYNFRKLITYHDHALIQIYLDGKMIYKKELK